MRIFSLFLIFICSCSSNPWRYNPPPGNGAFGKESVLKPVLLVDDFTSSSNIDARFSDVARKMQEAFARALLKTGKFEIVTDPSLASQAKDALYAYEGERDGLLQSIRNSLGSHSVFLVQGKVTDFLHTSSAPESVRRLSWFEEANDALVAMDITAIGLQRGRTVYSDQLVATVSAGSEAQDQYGSLEFGSYLFWSTPLGRASTQVIEEATKQLATLRGATPGIASIASYEEGSRALDIKDGDGLEDGGIYYVGDTSPQTGQYVAIDDDLGRPLRLRIEKGFFGSCTGWLLSEPASYEVIRGATLAKAPFPTQVTSE